MITLLQTPAANRQPTLDGEALARRLVEIDAGRTLRRIYVMGCGRSGTWLLTGFLNTFADVDVHAAEVPPEHFGHLDTDRKVLILKRDWLAYETAGDLPPAIEILLIVRHPFDVLTSHNPMSDRQFHIAPGRWLGEATALQALMQARRPGLHVLRYEDLVSDPQGMQAAMAKALGLTVAVAPDQMADVFAAPVQAERAMHGLRPIDKASIGRHAHSPQRIDRVREILPKIARRLDWFAATFGYDCSLEEPAPGVGRIGRPGAAADPFLIRPAAAEPGPIAERLGDGPIVTAERLPPRRGDHICGPSLIAAPDWLPARPGRYLLYFAHHRGQGIRLAVADDLAGPWRLRSTETLRLADATGGRDHVASPDVHVDEDRREILMYFHSMLPGSAEQKTFLARSTDGLTFRSDGRVLADFYLRVARWRGQWIGMAKGGVLYLADRPDGDFRRLPNPAFPMSGHDANGGGDVRHVALDVAGDRMTVYFSRIGDAPERICRATIDLSLPPEEWRATGEETVLVPERAWEGAAQPLKRSRAGAAHGPVHELRDPALFVEASGAYLLYSGAGESALGIARLLR